MRTQALTYVLQCRQTKWPMTLSHFDEGSLLETLDHYIFNFYVRSRTAKGNQPRWTKLQFVVTLTIGLGSDKLQPQLYWRRTECPVVSSLRRAILRIGRIMSVFDRYFKACELRSI